MQSLFLAVADSICIKANCFELFMNTFIRTKQHKKREKVYVSAANSRWQGHYLFLVMLSGCPPVHGMSKY